jgi:hypothetical protein
MYDKNRKCLCKQGLQLQSELFKQSRGRSQVILYGFDTFVTSAVQSQTSNIDDAHDESAYNPSIAHRLLIF